jgi:hypothetical protein
VEIQSYVILIERPMLVEGAVLRGYCGRLEGCTAFPAIIDVSLPVPIESIYSISTMGINLQ